MIKLSPEQLFEAIDKLYEAVEILESVLKEVETGAMRGIVISERLAEAWYKVNCCRLYTESDVNLDELNLEAMGLINDAKCMIESLVSWQKGMTLHGKVYTTSSICSALCNLRFVVCELEHWLTSQAFEESPTTLRGGVLSATPLPDDF